MLLGHLRRCSDADPEAVVLLERARAELSTGLAELRELARGIHPEVLTERGLEPALRSLAARAPAPVELAADADERLRAEFPCLPHALAALILGCGPGCCP